MQNFNDVVLPEQLLSCLTHIGFLKPTPIQAQAIPPALQGRDVLGSAQTGTGKTGAYGIPLVAQLLNTKRGSALILLPTRELAVQVMQALQQFIGRHKIYTALLIGGESMHKQRRQLQANPRLIVGTPGRTNDHLTRGSLQLKETNFLVLDEVDRMLDMGFRVQLDAIAKYLTAARQTLMFSATLPKNIQKFSSKYLTDPIRISVGETHLPTPKVKQANLRLSEGEKYPQLLEELQNRAGSILIFVKTKRAADRMALKLRKEGYKASALHGDLRQSKRNSVIAAFRKQKYRVLVATNVAARGLDIPHIKHVINYDLPRDPEDYIHRIGRTARAGEKGEAINFVTPADRGKWGGIQRLLNPGAKQEKNGRGKKSRARGKVRSFSKQKRAGSPHKKQRNKNKPQRHWQGKPKSQKLHRGKKKQAA